MNQAYLLLLYVTSDLFLLVSMVRSLKCCQQRRSALMVSNEVSTRVDLYSSCLRFCKWAGIAPLMFHFAMGWNCSAHASFRNRLESLSPCFISQWAGIAPPMIFAVDCSGLDSPTHFELLRPCFIILTDSSPVFSCLGQLRRILSSKPLINRHSRRRRS